MNIRTSLFLAVVLGLFLSPVGFARAAAGDLQLYQFSRPDNYRLDILSGQTNFPDPIRAVDRIDGVRYKSSDSLWDINTASNLITFRHMRPVGAETSAGMTKKTNEQLLALIGSNINPGVIRTYYQTEPLIFDSNDSKCGSPDYRPYCRYPNSLVVFYPFLFQGFPVYSEDGAAIGLAVVADQYTGEILYTRGLVNNIANPVTIPTANMAQSAANAYVMSGRLYDDETYLIPVVINTKVNYPADLSSFGFAQPTASLAPVAAPVQATPPPAVVVTPTGTNGKTYQIGNLKITIPQDKGVTSDDTVRVTTRLSSIRLTQGGVMVGQLMVLNKRSILYKNYLIGLGGTQIFQSNLDFVVLFYAGGSDKAALRTITQSFIFSE